jgi:hypothetical protein
MGERVKEMWKKERQYESSRNQRSVFLIEQSIKGGGLELDTTKHSLADSKQQRKTLSKLA